VTCNMVQVVLSVTRVYINHLIGHSDLTYTMV
jgi:hypothetical protein